MGRHCRAKQWWRPRQCRRNTSVVDLALLRRLPHVPDQVLRQGGREAGEEGQEEPEAAPATPPGEQAAAATPPPRTPATPPAEVENVNPPSSTAAPSGNEATAPSSTAAPEG